MQNDISEEGMACSKESNRQSDVEHSNFQSSSVMSMKRKPMIKIYKYLILSVHLIFTDSYIRDPVKILLFFFSMFIHGRTIWSGQSFALLFDKKK